MTNPIKEEILKEFEKKFNDEWCLMHAKVCDWKNAQDDKEVLPYAKFFLSSALDRYAREVIDEILPQEKTERSRREIYPTTGFEVATYEEKEAFNSCLSEVKRRADELLGKEEIVIVTAPCCKHIGVTSTCCCHCHPSSPNTYTAK